MRKIVVHKVVKDKRGCDYCARRDVGAISEIQIRFETPKGVNAVHWIDACSACIEGLKSGTLRFGPTGFPKAPGRRLLPEENRSAAFPTYGPRPRNGGFQCRDCKTEEYPLFGRGGKDRDFTYCHACLTRRYPTALAPNNATNDARRAAMGVREELTECHATT